MLIFCNNCRKRYEVQRSNSDVNILCLCGKTITVFPWVSYNKIISDQKRMKCPTCERIYDLQEYRSDTEIACSCKSLIIVKNITKHDDVHGRRNADQDSTLREAELHGLMDISRLIHSSIGDLNKLVILIVNVVTDMLVVEGSSVILKDNEKKGLVFYAVTGEKSSTLTSFQLAEGEGVVGNSIFNKTTIMVNNVEADTRFSKRVDINSGFITRSILCVPLLIDVNCIGALELVNKKGKDGFSKHDLQLTNAIAAQIAVAIHNVQLADEALKSERLAAIGQAVTGVSHCVKNMINGLRGGMYVLKSDLKKVAVDNCFRGYEMLERNVERLGTLVNDMLTYSKDRKPEYKPVDINDIVADVIGLMRLKAQEQNVLLTFSNGDNLKNVNVDSQGIYRAVLNLVSNAIDACEGKEGVSIGVSTSLLNDDEVVIEVTDQGDGMDKETINSIFQPFFSKKGSKGTGLGLSVTQKIIQEHGGHIVVNSVPGEGSTFCIHIPID